MQPAGTARLQVCGYSLAGTTGCGMNGGEVDSHAAKKVELEVRTGVLAQIDLCESAESRLNTKS